MEHIAHEETHHSVRIQIIQDECTTQPHRYMVGLAPMVVYSYRAGTATYGTTTVPDPLAGLDDVEAMQRSAAIVAALDVDPADFTAALFESAEDNRRAFPTPADFALVLEEMIAERTRIDRAASVRELDEWAAIFRACGIPAHRVTRTGYCQGDQCEILVIHTPEFRKLTGSPAYDPASDDPEKNGLRDMEGDADIFAAWAFGDVYGFTLATRDPDAATDDDDGWIESDEIGSSCFGFYARYGSTEWDHMLREARAAAEALAADLQPALAA